MRKKQWRQASTVLWSVILVVAVSAALFGVGGAGASSPHKTDRWPGMEEGTTFQNYTMYLYGDSSHAPGAEGVSIWYETIVHGLPEDGRRAWLNQSVTASPWVGACELNNLVHFGIDRGDDGTDNGTGGGTTTYYQTQTEGQVTSVDTNYEATWYGKEGVTNYRRFLGKDTAADEKHKEFPLSTSGWDAEFVQTSVTKFWDKEQAKSDDGDRQSGQRTTFEYENGDRVIVDYQDCYTNPDEPGWYRQASLSETYWVDQQDTAPADKTKGAPGGSNYVPVTYSHWVYICDCSSYDEAVSTLGEPPAMNGTKVQNPDEFAQYYGQSSEQTPTPGGSNGTATPGGSTQTATPGGGQTTTTTGGAQTTTGGGGVVQTTTGSTVGGAETTASRNTRSGQTRAPRTTRPAGAQTTSGPAQQNTQGTQTNGGGPGFGVVAALLALLVAALLARRR